MWSSKELLLLLLAISHLKKAKKSGESLRRRRKKKKCPQSFSGEEALPRTMVVVVEAVEDWGSCTNGYCPPFLFFAQASTCTYYTAAAMSLVSGAVMLEQLFLGPNSIMSSSSSTTTISCCCFCWPFFSSKGLLLLFLLYYTSAAENQEARPPQANRRINLSPAGPKYMQWQYYCRFRRRFFLAFNNTSGQI